MTYTFSKEVMEKFTSILESFSRIEVFTKSNTSYISEIENHFLAKIILVSII